MEGMLAARTPARLQIGRAGSRYKTQKYLDFRAAHAAANDAVMTEVSSETLEKLGLFEVRTKCKNKYDMITRPDWGRHFDDSQKEILRQNATIGADVQIYCGDGLSAPAIGANCCDMLPLLKMALEDDGISVGKPFFVRYCRVNTAREIGPLLNAKVVCVLIGERPGLITDESMSPLAYFIFLIYANVSFSPFSFSITSSRSSFSAVFGCIIILVFAREKYSRGCASV